MKKINDEKTQLQQKFEQQKKLNQKTFIKREYKNEEKKMNIRTHICIAIGVVDRKYF